MSKEKAVAEYGAAAIFSELLRADIYKRTQGKWARQLTCLAIWVAVLLTAWRLHALLIASGPGMQFGVAGTVAVLGLWVGYRLVNYAPFADFLIAVEAEMYKVSWPTRQELTRSSIVVVLLVVGLGVILFALDLILLLLLQVTGFVPSG